MTYNETAAVIFRITSAYPSQARYITKEMTEDMIREWHQSMRHLKSDGVMEAVTALVAEQKWMPSLSDVIGKILDIQYGTEDEIIRGLDRVISDSSTCIIFGQVTEEQKQGYEKLTPLQRLIIKSPYEFNLWLSKDHEWKSERIRLVKRDIQYGKHRGYLNGEQQVKALEGYEKERQNNDERRNYQSGFGSV